MTIFAPNNDAIADAISHGRLSANTTTAEIHDLLLNHVINGTVIFTGGAQNNYTSAGGELITIGTGGYKNGNVVYYKGELVADIVSSDVILQNGVMHVIDRVLPNFANDPSAATSAYGSYTASATFTGENAKRTRVSSRFFGKKRA